MSLFLQRLIEGLSNGAMYGVVAVALVIIFRATTLINFAQGGLAMFGAYMANVFAIEQGLPLVVGILLGASVMAVFAMGVERVLVRPFDPNDHLPVVLITFGVAYILQAVAAWKFGTEFKSFPSPFPSGPDDHLEIAGARLRYERLGVVAVLAIMVFAVHMLLTRTKVGLAFRAVSSNTESARLVGVKTGRTLNFGWALASFFGGIGGALVAHFTQLDSGFMDKVLIFSFAAATLGGLDSINGAVIGGLIIGLVESPIQPMIRENVPGFEFLTSDLALLVAFLLILAVLLVKPSGLFGTVRVERV
jgi:branched-chain amino acid transport system permease protein